VPYGYLIDPADRNHLIPDPETTCVVQKIFELYVRGERVCEIQRWLRDNEILTSGELRYRRSGDTRHPRPQLGQPCNWPDKTLYDILQRQEYLGHTVTAKTQKISYKSKKSRVNPEEKRYFFENTHEPLIDEATFELAQKRIATRNRPTKVDEIDIFSGLLFCADCGYKMYLMRGPSIEERKYAYTCGNYRNRARSNLECTTHYIRKSVLMDLVLGDLQRVLAYVQTQEREFVRRATEQGEKESQKALATQRRELDKAQARQRELDMLFRKLYEDNALGRISDQQFVMLTSGYEDEKATLTERIAGLEQEISAATDRKANVNRFLKIVRAYSDVQELTYENLHEFIDRILIHELDRETNTRKIEILYSFVGPIQGGEQVRRTHHYRQGKIDIDSFAM